MKKKLVNPGRLNVYSLKADTGQRGELIAGRRIAAVWLLEHLYEKKLILAALFKSVIAPLVRLCRD